MTLKVEFTEASRLRPLSAKRIREEFVEYESDIETDEPSFNMSLDSSVLETSFSTRSTSGHVGRIEEENSILKAENADLKAKLEKTQLELSRFKKFFKVTQKPTRANGSGGAPVYSPDLTAVAIEAMGETCEAKMVHRVMDAFGRTMGLTSPDDDTHRVPRPDWFVKTRSKLDSLLVDQRKDFLGKGGPFYVSFDATYLHSKNVISMVVFNKSLDYLNFGYKTVAAKTGRDIAAVMNQMLTEHDGLLDGLENFITDRCPSQELANRLVCDIINLNRPQHAQVNKH